jgi:integrase
MALVAVKPKKTSLALVTLADKATDYAKHSKADETRRGYESDLRTFVAFCEEHGEPSLPASPQIVALYLTHLAETGKAVATIGRHMVAISQAHKQAGLPNPVADPHVRAIAQGIRRKKGTAQREKTALTMDLLREVLATLDSSSIKGKRDRAILLLTFSIAGRRSEIAALDLADLRFERSGLVITIQRSKTDQEGAGCEIGVPFVPDASLCVVRAVKAWIEASGITEGALFRTINGGGKLTANRINGRDVARLVQRVTGKAGIAGDFAAHSLRAGFITTAANAPGVREVDIQRVSRHRSEKILRRYVRKANVFTDAPLSAMFK